MVVVANYLTLTSNLGAKVKRVSHGGRFYLVAPASLIVPGVLNGSDGPGYYPPEENVKNPSSWDGMPIVAYHPVTENGEPTSALTEFGKVDRKVYHRVGLGALRNSRGQDGRLLSEAWFDEEHVKNYDSKLLGNAKILPRLNASQPIELSTGLHVEKDEKPGTCPKTQRPYSWIARNHRPDHLAVLPDQRGACSIEDGCGVVVNAEVENAEESEGQWITISGTHVLVKDGEIVGGPAALVGRGKKDEGKGGGETHESLTKKVDDIVKRINAHGEKGRAGSKEVSAKLIEESKGLEALSKEVTSKMSKDELAKAAGLSKTPSSWSQKKLAEMVQKNVRDRMGTSFRVHNNEDATENADKYAQANLTTLKDDSEGKWVTLPNGVHIMVKDGEIVHGPEALKSKKTENVGKFGNPQHLESGQFLPHGSGTGKGEVHGAAREGRHGKQEPVENDCAGGLAENCSQTSKVMNSDKGDKTMTVKALKSEERTSLLTKLVANCKCSAEDAGVLNTLSDSALLHVSNAFPMAKQEEDPEDAADGGDDEEMENPDGSKKKVPPQFAKNQEKTVTTNAEVKTPTFEQLLEAAPPAYRAVWNVAVKVEHRERKALLERIVANLSADKKEATWNAFKDKPINELEAIANLIPAPQSVQNASKFPSFPNYAGAGVGNMEGVNNQAAGEEVLLDIPTINWADKVGA